MNVDQLIDSMLLVPYAPGAGDMLGADCWGVVEIWYKSILGIELNDRKDHPAGHGGMQAGFEAAKRWKRIQEPQDHCLVIMRAGRLSAGHVGVYYNGHVLHSEEKAGCVYEPIESKFLRSKITRFLQYK